MRAELAAERDETIGVLRRARGLLGLVEPESLRAPLAALFAARAEELARTRSVLGEPVVFAVQMAQALVLEDLRRAQ